MALLNKTHKRQAYRIRKKIEKMAEINTAISPTDLRGGCLIASFSFATYLWQKGIKAELVLNRQHAFVMVGKMVYDVTATQFGSARKVLIKKHAKLDKQYYWKPEARYTKLNHKFLRNVAGWPVLEVPDRVRKLLAQNYSVDNKWR